MTFNFATPFQIFELLAYPTLNSFDLSSLKLLWIGGDTVTEQTITTLRKLLPKSIVTIIYGLTEMQGVALNFDFRTDLKMIMAKPSSVGKGIQGCSYKVSVIFLYFCQRLSNPLFLYVGGF